ncbi:MAG: tetratricopeptide repeat protein [Vicinamibacterales bacterium]
MTDTVARPRLAVLWRRVALVALSLAAVVQSSSVRGAQGVQANEPFPRAARRALAHGRATEAEALARARPANDAAAAAVLGRLALNRGAYDEALKILEPAAAADPRSDAALELGLLSQRLGRTDQAARLLTSLSRQAGSGSDVETLLRAGRAAHALSLPHDADAYFKAAAERGTDPAVQTAYGAMFLDIFYGAEALKAFQAAIAADPEWAPGYAGVARTLADENPTAAAEAANKALSIDPTLADAHLTLAQLDLDSARYDAARERIDKVLTLNERDLDARSLLAAVAYVRTGREAFDAEGRKVLAINPRYGELYRVAADLAARNYRFDEAVVLSREAVALDPSNTRAFADLGLQLMRTGDEAAARPALDRAFSANGFDKITKNLLDLLDKLNKFDVVQEADLTFKFSAEETPVMREYAIPLAREALAKLSAKYQFTPKGPILIEIFPVHDDFAVRNLGLPGLIGALGACFGRVVSIDSPKAREPGTFSWQETLWHELTHVITLQMSKQRVPRWLTEGVSVYEERQARPEWGREMEVPFAIAMEQGKVLKLKDLNSGFTKAETIALAYFEASLLVDHIVASKGEAALRQLLLTYGDGTEGDAAIQKGLGVSIDQLQTTFDASLDTRFSALRAALRDQPQPQGREPDVNALRLSAGMMPGSYRAQMAYGLALAEQGDKTAFEPLGKAAALIPVAIGEQSPHAVMARLAEKLSDPTRAIAEYKLFLANDHTDVAAARQLATLAEKAGDEPGIALARERVVALDPFDAEAHTGLGRVALKRKDATVAIREFKAALVTGAADQASAHCDLADAYLLAAKPADAKREALAALEIAPSFERAQDLLLKSVEGKGGQ